MTREEIMNIPKLGFGLMRLPEKDGHIDIEKTCEMVDMFLAKGYKYFDTAYLYGGGESERAVKEALTKRHPRDSFYVATKIPNFAIKSKEDMDKIFNEELERTGLEYIDFYLLHNLTSSNIDAFEACDCWEWLKAKKEAGLIKNYGFSCHDGPEFLEKALTEHPDVDFVQLQINYADWEAENVKSGACYETVVKHGVPVMIMEPVKGGTLAQLRPELEEIFKEANPDASVASWAIRYAAGLPGAAVVLSGMSTIEQVEDNLATFENIKPLSDEEMAVIEKVKDIMASADTIPCTSCKYCVDGCPMQINIPGIFSIYNSAKTYGLSARNKSDYENRHTAHASDCIACGQCEEICPQHLPIIEKLKEISQMLGK